MKWKCQRCGELTGNDQSFEIKPLGASSPHRVEVHRCDRCDKRFHQELDWESEGETYNENRVVCPYCGHEYDDYDSYSFGTDTDEVECRSCGHEFILRVEVKKLFSTRRSLSEMPENYGEEEE